MAKKAKSRLRRQRTTRVRTTLCKEGAYQLVIMAFLLAAALIRQINLLMLIFAGLTVPILWNWYFVRASLKNLRFTRKAPATCAAGDKVVIVIEATNERSRRISWAVVATDRLRLVHADVAAKTIAARPTQGSVVFHRIRPGETVREAYEGEFTQRGEYRLGPIEISTRFPLGLIKRSYRIKMPQTIIVQPRQGRLTNRWRERSQRSFQGGITVAQRLGIVEAEFHGLREFRSGDSKSWIHWRTTARRGEPIVRQFEQQQSLDMTVVLDLWVPAHPKLRDLENVELACSFAATLISTQAKRGLGRLVLATHQHEPKLTRGGASNALVRESLSDLALARASKDDHLPVLLNQALSQGSNQGELVIVSTRPNNLKDATRFAGVGAAARKDNWRSRAVYVDCSSPELNDIFQLPGAEQAPAGILDEAAAEHHMQARGRTFVERPSGDWDDERDPAGAGAET